MPSAWQNSVNYVNKLSYAARILSEIIEPGSIEVGAEDELVRPLSRWEIYKQHELPKLLASTQAEFVYQPDKGMSEELFKTINADGGYDEYLTEDMFAGNIGKTDVCFCEVRTNEEKLIGDEMMNVFDGILFAADFHKHFKSDLTVIKDDKTSMLGWADRVLGKYERNFVRLENPEFEKQFLVCGEDQVEARYILTPDMQERITALNDLLEGGLEILFRDSKLYLIFAKKGNWFEPGYWMEDEKFDPAKEFIKHVKLCCGIVEQLNLNTRIWTKE